MSLDIAGFAMTAAEQRVIASHYLPAARRALLASEHGEIFAAEYERTYNAVVGEAMLPKLREGFADGAREERERCRAILESPAAKGRQQAAVILATETDLTPDAARRILVSLGTASGLAARMMGMDPLDLDPDDAGPRGR